MPITCWSQQNGKRISTLEVEPERLPPPEECATIGAPCVWDRRSAPASKAYLCSGIRLLRGDNSGDMLYILYPESLWRDALWEAIWPSLVLGGSVGAASVALAIGWGRA